jgi:large subunit ribosomal protein L15
MRIGNIKPAKGATRARKRRGMGPASGLGGTAGRGHKGQLARSGGKVARWFEGGQMPIQRRLPKRGFHPHAKVAFQVVNVAALDRFEKGQTVDRAALHAKRLIGDANVPVKILGQGELQNALTVSVDAVSASARAKIEGAGGTIQTAAPKTYRARGVKKARG